IRDKLVTGVQTCALPISLGLAKVSVQLDGDQKDVGYGDNSKWTERNFTFTALRTNVVLRLQSLLPGSQVDTVTLTEVPSELNFQIGRASCRERVEISGSG